MAGPSRGGRLRVIGGENRGRRIATLPGDAIRPTSDRVREALFDILGPAIEGARFLDLYAGTGAVGIEALSRGAAAAVFVEQERRAVELLRANLAAAGSGADSRARVVPHDVARALPVLETEGSAFDVVFMDPPWAGGELDRGIRLVGRFSILASGAIVVAEHESSSAPPVSDRLAPHRTARYGRAALTFYHPVR